MLPRLQLTIVCVPMIVLVGCAILPPPTPPDLSTPQTTRTGLKIVNHSNDLSHTLWWKKLHDSTLNQFIKEALANNNQIKTARANVLQAQAKLKAARFTWLPTLGATGQGFIGGGWNTDFTPPGSLAESPALNKLGNIHFSGYYSGFVPSYSLNILANINTNRLAKASLNLQKAAYQSSRLSVISQMTGAYFMLLSQREQLNNQSQIINDLRKMHQLEKIRFKEGASDASYITSLEQQIHDHQANLSLIENSIAEIENAIQLLLNRNPGPIDTHRSIYTLSVKHFVPKNLPAAVLKNRPDLIMAKENLILSESNLGLAYSNFFPTISLTGLLGNGSVELSRILKLSTNLWIAQLAASMPMINGGLYEQIAGAKAGHSAAFYTYIQTLRSVFVDVDNCLTNQQKMNKIYYSQLHAFQVSKKTYALALAKYKAGAKDYREVANALLVVDYAKLNLTLAKMQQLDSLVELYQALAGGYESDTTK